MALQPHTDQVAVFAACDHPIQVQPRRRHVGARRLPVHSARRLPSVRPRRRGVGAAGDDTPLPQPSPARQKSPSSARGAPIGAAGPRPRAGRVAPAAPHVALPSERPRLPQGRSSLWPRYLRTWTWTWASCVACALFRSRAGPRQHEDRHHRVRRPRCARLHARAHHHMPTHPRAPPVPPPHCTRLRLLCRRTRTPRRPMARQ